MNASADLPRIERPSDTIAMRLPHVAIAEGKAEVLRLLIERVIPEKRRLNHWFRAGRKL